MRMIAIECVQRKRGSKAAGVRSRQLRCAARALEHEHADRAPIKAARAVGATPLQVNLHGVLPHVLPQIADVTIYQWENNFHASVTVGVVGAGGIGFELIVALRTLEYRQIAAIVLSTLATVTAAAASGGHP